MKERLSPSVNKWISRLSPTTARSRSSLLNRWLVWLRENGDQFADMTPDELVAYIQDSTQNKQFKLLDKVQEWINSFTGQGLRDSTLITYYVVIRSFFMHNRAELPKDPSFIIRAETPPVKGKLTLEDVRDIINKSNRTYRAVFISMFQGAMGLDEFVYWNLNGWADLQKDLNENKSFIEIDLPGRRSQRHKRPYRTFLGGDAKAEIKKYLSNRQIAEQKFYVTIESDRHNAELRGEKYIEEKFNPNAIFYSQKGRPFNKNSLYRYWFRKCVELGLIIPKNNGKPSNRYGYNPHEMRDVFRTQWEKTPAKASVGEYMMGHSGDPLKYNKAYKDDAWVISELKKALPMLNILSSNVPFGLVSKEKHENDLYETQEELRKYKKEIELLKMSQTGAGTELSDLRTDMNVLKDEMAQMRNNSDIPV